MGIYSIIGEYSNNYLNVNFDHFKANIHQYIEYMHKITLNA